MRAFSRFYFLFLSFSGVMFCEYITLNLSCFIVLLILVFPDSSPIRRPPSAADMASGDSPKLRVRTMVSGEVSSRTSQPPAATSTTVTTTTASLEPVVVSSFYHPTS